MALTCSLASKHFEFGKPAKLRDDNPSSGSHRSSFWTRPFPKRGKQLSYFGYVFEVPWDEIDQERTKVMATNTASTIGLRLGADDSRYHARRFFLLTPKRLAIQQGMLFSMKTIILPRGS